MRIAIITPGFSAGPDDWAIPALQALATRLGRRHDVHVFSLRYPQTGSYQWKGITVHAAGGGDRVGIRSVAVWAKTLNLIRREQRRGSFDVFHSIWADEAGLVGLLAARLWSRPVIVSAAGGELVYFRDIGYGTAGSPWRRRMIRLVLRQADSVTGGSGYQLELCRSAGASRSRLAWAPLGVDVKQFTPARPPTSPPFWIVQAASLTPVKRQALLLELLAQVRREADVRLLLVGDGPARTQLLAQADSLQIGDAVTWAGRVPYPQMPDYLRRAHVYVQSSWHEAQGMAPLEALACGLPVLGTPVGILPEVAARPATASVAELSEQVLELAQNRSVYLEARAAARRRAEVDFSCETSLARFNKLYESVR